MIQYQNFFLFVFENEQIKFLLLVWSPITHYWKCAKHNRRKATILNRRLVIEMNKINFVSYQANFSRTCLVMKPNKFQNVCLFVHKQYYYVFGLLLLNFFRLFVCLVCVVPCNCVYFENINGKFLNWQYLLNDRMKEF